MNDYDDDDNDDDDVNDTLQDLSPNSWSPAPTLVMSVPQLII